VLYVNVGKKCNTIHNFLLATGKKSIFKEQKHTSDGNQKYKHRSALRLEASSETSVICHSPSAVSSTRNKTIRGKESILTFKRDRQRKYKHNIEGSSRKHYCRGKAISITQFVCVCVCVCSSTYPPLYCHLWSSDSTTFSNIFLHFLISGTTVGKKVTDHKICV
jgi:hypothetical protein